MTQMAVSIASKYLNEMLEIFTNYHFQRYVKFSITHAEIRV